MKNFFFRNHTRVLMGLGLVLAISIIAPTVHAVDYGTPPAPDTGIQSVADIFTLIDSIFNIMFWLLIVLAGVFIIWAAFNYLTAGGDPEKVKVANQKVIYAAVAVVVAVLAKAIPTVICSFLSTGCQFRG